MKAHIAKYKPRSQWDAPVDSSRCAASVHDEGRGCSFHQCSRKKKIGEWCTQHHPDNVRKRELESQERWEQESRARARARDAMDAARVSKGYLKALRVVARKFQEIQGAEFG